MEKFETQTWYYTSFRKQSLVDLWKILSVFGLPVVACIILTIYLFTVRGIGIASVSSMLLSAALVASVGIYMYRTWRDVRDFRSEDNFVRLSEAGLEVSEAGDLKRFAWEDIRTVQEFYALGYGCNLKVILKNVREDGLYEHYSFNVDGIPNAAVMYGKQAMMAQILAKWEAWQSVHVAGSAANQEGSQAAA